jgi:hypothetical protein
MSGNLVLIDAADALPASSGQVGGKGKQLGLLCHYGLPVPDFFVIPAAWSRQRGGAFPPSLQDLLQAELAARGWLDTPLAARSSAVGEDAAAASFAGIFLSRLNIRGLSALTVAVGEIWASLDSPTAAAYRERLDIGGEPAMAVVVMPLLPAVASGIAFTCDPVSGREDRIVVQANWGLGESLVGGEAAATSMFSPRTRPTSGACSNAGRAARRGCRSRHRKAAPSTGRWLRRGRGRSCSTASRRRPWPRCCAMPPSPAISLHRFMTLNGSGMVPASG